jgi:hypothetical protein
MYVNVIVEQLEKFLRTVLKAGALSPAVVNRWKTESKQEQHITKQEHEFIEFGVV